MVTRRMFGALLISCSIVICQSGVAVADDYRTIENSSPQEVVNGMMTKAGRGLANVATGWVELPKQIYTTSKEDGTARGIFIGPFKGMGMMLVRTVAGAGELLTFFVAYPGFYDPYFDPGFVWEKE
ncbi:MAG: exosortase system-associated protein, TIGR04073 family [Geobacteraceae bacterium]